MVAVIVLLITLLLSGSAMAGEASLVDVLQAKWILSQEEAQKLRSAGAARGDYDQQALINLLRKKGILEENDLAQLQTPPAVVAAPAAPEVTQWLSHLESKQLETQARVEAMET